MSTDSPDQPTGSSCTSQGEEGVRRRALPSAGTTSRMRVPKATYHPLVEVEAREAENNDDDDDDFEKILVPTKSPASSGSSSSRFTKSDKSDFIHMLYDGEVQRNEEGDEGDDVQDNVTFLHPGGEKDRNKGRKKNRMKEYLIGEKNPDEDEDDLQLPSPFAGGRTFLIEADDEEEESSVTICIQVFIPFLVAGFGTVGAGLVLDYVQHWEVFQKVSEVFILVPALLGLKGNLEMTLASRLSTAANLGLLDSRKKQWQMSVGNMALIQAQAAVVALLAAVFAILMDWLPEGEFNMQHAVLLIASSLLTASVASFLLGILMILVVIFSHSMNINPDNVATPIAASLGDLTTLALLANFSSVLFYTTDDSIWLCIILIVVLLILVPVWVLVAHSCPSTRAVLYYGWSPVISAMAISSAGGMILDFAVSRFTGIAVFQPVINGVGGNLVAVQASRISTYMHKRSILGILPKDQSGLCASPLNTFCGNHVHAKTARVLLFIAIPGHLIFTYGIRLLQAGHTSVTPTFLVVYLTAAMLQILILLFLARSMILFMWERSIDPDNSAIPYLTAFGDLLGTALLALAFYIMFAIGNKDTDVGD